jgi:hypothetical protein
LENAFGTTSFAWKGTCMGMGGVVSVGLVHSARWRNKH